MKKEISIGAIVLNNKNQILILRPSNKEYWEFPKGNLEKGESEEECMKRELKEETNIKNIKIIPGFKEEIHYFYRLKKDLISKRVIYYLVQSDDKIKLSWEHQDFKWVSLKDLKKYLKFPTQLKLYNKLLKFLDKNPVNESK